MYIPPPEIKILLESSPRKSRILVRRWAVAATFVPMPAPRTVHSLHAAYNSYYY